MTPDTNTSVDNPLSQGGNVNHGQSFEDRHERRLQEAYDHISSLELKNVSLESDNKRLLENLARQQTIIEAYEKKLSELPAMIEGILERERDESQAAANAAVTTARAAGTNPAAITPLSSSNVIVVDDDVAQCSTSAQRVSPLTERSRGPSFSEFRSSIISNKSKPFFASNFAVRECTPTKSSAESLNEQGLGDDDDDECRQRESGATVPRSYFWNGWRKGSDYSNGSTSGSGDSNRDRKTKTSRTGSAGSSVRSSRTLTSPSTTYRNNDNEINLAPLTLRPSEVMADACTMASMDSEAFSAALTLDPTQSDRSHNRKNKGACDESQNITRRNQAVLDLVM